MTVRAAAPFADTVARVREAPKEQGFGVLTEIDVRATSARNSAKRWRTTSSSEPATRRSRTADRKIGLLLPCNVVIRAGDGSTTVEALDPRPIADIAGQPTLTAVTSEAASRIRAALQALQDEQPPGLTAT
jgi:uncharacterized protein (DUF302 family)